jgi:hypothetical protein
MFFFKQGNKIVYLNCTFYLTAFWNSRPTVKDAVEKWFCVEKILRKKQKNIGMLFYVPIDLTMYFIQLTFVFSIWHKASKETIIKKYFIHWKMMWPTVNELSLHKPNCLELIIWQLLWNVFCLSLHNLITEFQQ